MNSLLTLAYKFSQIVWKFTNPITIGVRVIVVNNGTFLLVKPSYQESWTLPGGGVEPRETLEDTARRELREEAGVEAGDLQIFGIYTSFLENKNDHVVVFWGQLAHTLDNHQPDAEIDDYEFYDLKALPENTAAAARRRLQEFASGNVGPYTGMW